MIYTDILIAIIMIIIAVIDWREKYIYTIHLLIAFALVGFHHLAQDYTYYLLGGFIAFFIGYAMYYTAFAYYKEEVFGWGDVLLLGILGFYFGWPTFIHYFSITYLSVGLSSLCSLIFIPWNKLRKINMPMAPIYVAGAFIFKFWGCPTLLNAYYDIYIYASAVISKVTMFFVLL